MQQVRRNFLNIFFRLKSPQQPLKNRHRTFHMLLKSKVKKKPLNIQTKKTKSPVREKYQTGSRIIPRNVPSICGKTSTGFLRKNVTDKFSTKPSCHLNIKGWNRKYKWIVIKVTARTKYKCPAYWKYTSKTKQPQTQTQINLVENMF